MENVIPGSVLTLDERRRIRELLDDGDWTFLEIAEMMGRSKTTVHREVMRNGGRAKYDPEISHKEMYERFIRRQEQNIERARVNRVSFLKEIRDKLQILEDKLDRLLGDV